MKRILVRLPQAVGDAVMSTAMLRALRALYPHSTIDVAGGGAIAALIEELPYFDTYLTVERGRRGRRRLARMIRGSDYDCALILPNSAVSVWPMLYARIPRRVGYTKYPVRRFLLSDPVPVPYDERGRFVPTPMHEYYLGLVRRLGGEANADPWPEVALRETDRATADDLCKQHGLDQSPYVVLSPGAAFGTSKLWTPEGWGWLAGALHRHLGVRIVLCGGPGEAEHAREIMNRMQVAAVDFATEPVGLGPLYGIIENAAMVVTLDSGPRHLAVAARKPIVCLMGPNDRRYTECCMDQTVVLQLDQLHCIACHFKRCPTEHECMRMLPKERVLDAALRQWPQAAAVQLA